MGERCVRNAEVEGSIPFRSTKLQYPLAPPQGHVLSPEPADLHRLLLPADLRCALAGYGPGAVHRMQLARAVLERRFLVVVSRLASWARERDRLGVHRD